MKYFSLQKHTIFIQAPCRISELIAPAAFTRQKNWHLRHNLAFVILFQLWCKNQCNRANVHTRRRVWHLDFLSNKFDGFFSLYPKLKTLRSLMQNHSVILFFYSMKTNFTQLTLSIVRNNQRYATHLSKNTLSNRWIGSRMMTNFRTVSLENNGSASFM